MRPRTWKSPPLEKVIEVLSKYTSRLSKCHSHRDNVFADILKDLGCCATQKERLFIFRTWKREFNQNSSTSGSSDDEVEEEPRISEYDISFSAEEWLEIRPVVNIPTMDYSMCDWGAAFANKLIEIAQLSRCTIIAVKHYVSKKYRQEFKNESGIITGTLRCSNSCPVTVRFTSAHITPSDGASFRCRITGSSTHLKIKPRQLRGIERIKEVAIGMNTPSERRAQLIEKLGHYSSRVPSSAVIAKARSECGIEKRGSTDWISELRMLHQMSQPAFIRCLEVIPFRLMVWSEKMISCYKEMAKKFGRPELYMDATGGILRNIDSRQVLVVSIVIPGVQRGSLQIAVAMMLTNSSDTASYTNFLQRWWSAVAHTANVTMPSAIIVDRNWPSIHAISLIFNGMDVIQYLKLCYAIMSGLHNSDAISRFTIIGLGKFHTIRSIVNWNSVKGGRDRATTLWWKYAAAFVTRVTSWPIMTKYLRSLFAVLLVEFGDVSTEVRAVSDFCHRGDEIDFDYMTNGSKTDEELHGGITSSTMSLYAQSPFYSEAKILFNKVDAQKTTTISRDMIDSGNPKYNPKLAEDILKNLVAYAPMVSGILYRPERYAKEKKVQDNVEFHGWTEAFVEGWHSILKNHILRDKVQLSPQEFTTITSTSLSGRATDFLEQLKFFNAKPDASEHSDETELPDQFTSPYEAEHSDKSVEEVSAPCDSIQHNMTFESEESGHCVDLDKSDSESGRNVFRDITNWSSTTQFSDNRKGDISYQATLSATDDYKKKKKRRSVYTRPVTISGPTGLEREAINTALPTGSQSRVEHHGRKVSLSAKNTCCLDNILMVSRTFYTVCDDFRHEIDRLSSISNDQGLFAKCVQQMAASNQVGCLIEARAKLLLDAAVFRGANMAEPLQELTKCRYSVSLDTNETSLAERLMLPLCRLFRRSVCSNMNCEDRLIWLKHILIEEFNITTTLISLSNERQSPGKCRTLTDSGEPCDGVRVESPIEHAHGEAPSVIIFCSQDPTDINDQHRSSYPPLIDIFNERYSLSAITYLRRPSNLLSSGHYICCMKNNTEWIEYDGLRKNSKPPYLRHAINLSKYSKKGLFANLFFYTRILE